MRKLRSKNPDWIRYMPDQKSDTSKLSPDAFIFAWRAFLIFFIVSTVFNVVQLLGTETVPYSKFIEFAQNKQLTNVAVRKQEIVGSININGRLKKFRTV